MFDSGLLKSATSYLFTNFPQNWSPKRLWYLFATYGAGLGRIVDVFIPKKKDRKGNCFGFVRFSGVKDKGRLEKSLKMICFGTEKLRVTLATERKPSQPKLAMPRHLPPPPSSETLKSRSFADALLNRPTPKPSNQPLLPKNQSHPQLAANTSEQVKEQAKILEVEDDVEDSSWLCNCATCEVLEPRLIPGLQQKIWENGFTFISVIPMGGSNVLLKANDKGSLDKFIEEEESWWSKWFKRIKPWSPSDIATERLVWFTNDKECLDAARILISTAEANQIDKEITLRVRSQLFPLKITEERWRTDPWWLKASDVYDSDDSDPDGQSVSESDQFSGSWGFPSDDEVEQPCQAGKQPLNELLKKPADFVSPKRIAILDNNSATLGKAFDEPIKCPVFENGGHPWKPTSSP
ncbi:hypothetical protein SLEP1_g32064 [Rubroshorea leprosula]|uniref:RRM domain-containing protein n=1 Tax=Rubroshorea leprosula TaxID=152421 RepID=A0AAV5KC41_9ROSI|nr:hypothetical protein SLEP1_g32064 [Rubroshorea leprosula]